MYYLGYAAICAYVFVYAKSRFSQGALHFIVTFNVLFVGKTTDVALTVVSMFNCKSYHCINTSVAHYK